MMTTFLKHKKQKPKTFLEVTLLSLLAASPLAAQADDANAQSKIDSLTKEVGELKAEISNLKNLIHRNENNVNLGIGDEITLSGTYATSIGEWSNASGNSAMALGAIAKAIGNNVTAIGAQAQATANSASAIGANAHATADSATAIGSNSVGTGESSIALGVQAHSEQNASIAIGPNSKSTNEGAIAMGDTAQSNGDHGIAIGSNTESQSDHSIVIGYEAKSFKYDPNKPAPWNMQNDINRAETDIAIGMEANAQKGIALGGGAQADRGIAIGTRTQSWVEGAVALGNGAIASDNSDKKDIDQRGYDPSTGKDNEAKEENATSDVTWKPTTGQVSLGTASMTRRIKHLAAGHDDTDAVNVAQLKQLRFHYTVNGDTPRAIPLDKPLTFINGTNTTAKMDSDGKVHYDVNSDLKNITSISNGDKGAKISLGNADKNISVNNGKLTNVADGNISDTSKDAINGSQLEKYVTDKLKNLDVSNVVDKKLQNQKIAYKANGKDAKEVSLGMGFDFTNGHNTTASIGDNGKVIYDVNSDLKNITSISNGDKGAKISLDKADNHINVNGGKLTNVANGKVSADSKEAINGSQLKKVEDEKLNIDGSNMQSDKQATFGSHVGIASLSNPQDADSSKLVQAKAVKNYVDDKLKNLDVGGAIDQKLQNQKIAYKANGETAKKVTLGTGFDFTNGRNTTASIGDNGKVIYDVNQDLQEIHSISGASAGTGAKISLGTQDKNIAVNQGKVTQLAAGEVSATSTDAVNGSQLYGVDKKVNLNTENIRKNNELINRGLGFAGNEGKGNQKLGSWMTIEGSQKVANTSYSSDNITTSYQQDAQGNGTLRIEIKDAPTFKALTVGQTSGDTVQIKPAEISVKAKNGKKVALTAQGLDNGSNVISNVGDGVAPTDAVNRRQLDNVAKRMGNIGDNINAQIHKVQKKANAGHAATMAAALLPQPFAAGRSMVGAAVGAYRDQQAVAIGVARTSDNGKWIVRAAVTEDTQNGVGGGASFGYQW